MHAPCGHAHAQVKKKVGHVLRFCIPLHLQFIERPFSELSGVAIGLLLDVPMETHPFWVDTTEAGKYLHTGELLLFMLTRMALMLACHVGLWWWRRCSGRAQHAVKSK